MQLRETLFLAVVLCVGAVAADNRVCVGGANAAKACTTDADCPNGQCAGFTMAPARGGLPSFENCPPNGHSDNPGNTPAVLVCYGGLDAGKACTSNSDCRSAGDGKPTVCDSKKADPTDPRDQDVDGDAVKDYFMGEWKFVDGASKKNVIVRKWCLNGGAPKILAKCQGGTNDGQPCANDTGCPGGGTCKGIGVSFQDAFAFEVRTSINGTENEQNSKRIRPSTDTLT
jgi:hypothetical protein